MSKKISEIYEEYKIMPSLQKHMFRVAGVASIICDNFEYELPKGDIVSACLLHDMGNIIKSELGYFTDFPEYKDIKYWQDVKESFIQKYGLDCHVAVARIAEEIGVSEEVVGLVDVVGFSRAEKNFYSKNFAEKICAYADMRVGPYGVLSLEERFIDAGERYKTTFSADGKRLQDFLRQIEKQIFAKCKIKPEDINDASVGRLILDLNNFLI